MQIMLLLALKEVLEGELLLLMPADSLVLEKLFQMVLLGIEVFLPMLLMEQGVVVQGVQYF